MRLARVVNLRVKLPDTRIGWVRKDLLTRDEKCLPDRKEVMLEPPMIPVNDAPGPKGRVDVEADIDESGKVKAVRVVTNETAQVERTAERIDEIIAEEHRTHPDRRVEVYSRSP